MVVNTGARRLRRRRPPPIHISFCLIPLLHSTPCLPQCHEVLAAVVVLEIKHMRCVGI